MSLRPLLAVAVLLLLAACATAPPQRPPTIALPLVDSDNFSDGLHVPSMQQSLELTAGFYEAAHYAIGERFEERPLLRKFLIALFDVGTGAIAPLPFGDVWLHEEFHRAVMGNRGIGSFNDVYKFDFGAEAIAVSRVRDEDLIRLKRDHPAEMVRLHSAGQEGEYALVRKLQQDSFFEQTGGFHRTLYWLAKVSTAGYIGSGTDDEIIDDTREWEREEGANVRRRDFTGHDFTAWVYDMSRRDEPYTARGIHPSGVGIRRYITPDMLTVEERRFLDRQGTLQLLNFVDPHLIGFDSWRTGATRWAASLGHVLTPFGYSVDLNLMVDRNGRNLLVVLHGYSNEEKTFPGVDVTLVDHPIVVWGQDLRVSPRIALWQQPADLRFRTGEAKSGGLVGLRVESPWRGRWAAFAETTLKSEGWVLASVHLDSNAELRIGGSYRLP